jgi:hypothetical protein
MDTGMRRLNFTLDDETVQLLGKIAGRYYQGNKSQTVRAALESLAAHAGHEGWVIAGYSPVVVEQKTRCHTCGDTRGKGETLYRPVFERGEGPRVLSRIPTEVWLDCPDCVEQQAR